MPTDRAATASVPTPDVPDTRLGSLLKTVQGLLPSLLGQGPGNVVVRGR